MLRRITCTGHISAPWLSEAAPYRLTLWPNFGVIRRGAPQLRVAATLASAELDVGQLARRMKISREESARNMNALSVCDSLDVGSGSRMAAITRAVLPQLSPKRGFVSFLRNVRKHLGLRTDEPSGS